MEIALEVTLAWISVFIVSMQRISILQNECFAEIHVSFCASVIKLVRNNHMHVTCFIFYLFFIVAVLRLSVTPNVSSERTKSEEITGMVTTLYCKCKYEDMYPSGCWCCCLIWHLIWWTSGMLRNRTKEKPLTLTYFSLFPVHLQTLWPFRPLVGRFF